MKNRSLIRNIFFVKSPLQLLNALEARQHFGLDDRSCCLILMGDRKSYQQIARLVQTMEEWSNVILLNRVGLFQPNPWSTNIDVGHIHKSTKHFLESSFFNIMRLNRLAASVGEVEYIFIGDNNNVFMRHLVNTTQHKYAVLLDDGTATLEVARQRLEGVQKKSPKRLPKKIKLAARRILQGMNDRQPEEVTFFTAYNVEVKPPDSLVQNDFAYIRKKAGNTPCSTEVYFLGSPISEVGFMTEESYIEQLLMVRADFSDKTFVYVAHRRENPHKLKRIQESMGIEVVLFDYPVEYQIAVVGPRPACVVSFFTSALDSLYKIMGEKLEIVSYRLMQGSYAERNRIDPIYRNYESNSSDHFRVVNL